MQHNPPAEFHQPQGFLSLAKNVGIKDNTLDLTVIYSTVRARAAAMFTRNRFPGAPVIVGRKHIARGFVQALVINSKNANVAIGKQGIDNAIETCRIVGEELGVNPYDVLPFSTGVIGRPMLRRVVDRTFNCMSIDTDTSTSDTVVLMANGLAGKAKLGQFEKGLLEVCEYLTKEIARSGEGATKLITVDVSHAKTEAQAKRVAKSVVNSPLVKTAVYGCDPNWGRVIMAVGKCFDPSIEPAKVTIRFGNTNVFRKGSPVDCDLESLRRYLRQPEVTIAVDLGIGKASTRVWGCDLTEGYIKENAYYTT